MENNEKIQEYNQFPDWTTRDTVLCWITWLSLLGGIASFMIAITGGHPYPFADPRCDPNMPTVPGKWWEWGIACIVLLAIFCNTAGWGDRKKQK